MRIMDYARQYAAEHGFDDEDLYWLKNNVALLEVVAGQMVYFPQLSRTMYRFWDKKLKKRFGTENAAIIRDDILMLWRAAWSANVAPHPPTGLRMSPLRKMQAA